MSRSSYDPTDVFGHMQEEFPAKSEFDVVIIGAGPNGLIAGAAHLEEALRAARQLGVYLLLSAIGFESFDDTILRNLNKGISVQENLEAVRLIRRLKAEFPPHLGYSTQEGAIHGFIHPTPWDSREIFAGAQETMYLYGLPNDILPRHSIPLIIHHASGLGAWIREIEQREGIRYKRSGSIICWWEVPAGCRTLFSNDRR